MKRLTFWKMSGSGNDFVLVDNRRKAIGGNVSAWARRLCHRQFGVGADGLLLLEPSAKGDFRMVYYNADGSRASMCGNGARCMAWAAHAWGVAGADMDFRTDAGMVHGKVRGNIVRIALADPLDYRSSVRLNGAWKGKGGVASIRVGVPHAVVRVPRLEAVDIAETGRFMRFHPAFGRHGTNVNFIQRLGDHRLRVRTYERGVEGETLACGTGVTASAVAAALRGWVKAPVGCLVAGGDMLRVDFELHPDDPAHPATRVTLEGPVRLVFTGSLSLSKGKVGE
jgi:diaminopimelate epimerase